MALSEREQQVLRDLESQLHEDDPELAQTFQREERRLSRPSPRHIGGGVAPVSYTHLTLPTNREV